MTTQNGKEEWHSTMEKAQAILEEGRREMAKATAMAREKGEEAWRQAEQKGKEALSRFQAAGLNALDDVKDQTEEVWEDAEKLVKKYPARAIGLTLLVGVVIGTLLSRERD